MFQLTREKGIDSFKASNFGKLVVIVCSSSKSDEYKRRFDDMFEFYDETRVAFASCQDGECGCKCSNDPSVLVTSSPDVLAPMRMSVYPAEVLCQLDELLSRFTINFEKEKQVYFKKIEQMVQENAVQVFIKGSALNPFCKYTRRLVEALTKLNLRFGFYDLRVDKTMSSYLKVYSGWPTLPQVFVNGKIIGGGDTILSLIEENKFQMMIPPSCFFTKLDSLKQTNKHLVLFNSPGQEAAIAQQLRSKNIDFSLYNMALDPQLQAEILQLKGSLQTYLVFQDQILASDEVKL